MTTTILTATLILSLTSTLVSARSSYIINGQDVDKPGKYPWQASLWSKDKPYGCSAILIHESWLLTAAHCLISTQFSTVWLGMHDKRKLQGQPQAYEIEKAIPHEDFSRSQKHRARTDIGLIKLRSPAKLNAFVQIISMNEKRDAFLS